MTFTVDWAVTMYSGLISSAHLDRQDFIQPKISLHFCYSSFVCQITVGFPVCHLKKESTPKMCTVLSCAFLNAPKAPGGFYVLYIYLDAIQIFLVFV